MRRGPVRRLATGAIGVAALIAMLGGAVGAFEPPSADEIVRKWLTVHASAPKIVAADATLAIRAKIPATAPPTCAYAAKITKVCGKKAP